MEKLMKHTDIIKSARFWNLYFLSLISTAVFLSPLLAMGAPQNPPLGEEVPCAVLEEYDGELQILDGSREALLKTTFGSQIPCGGWLSVESGWAELKHRQGFRIRIRSGTFVQIFDRTDDHHQTGEDHLVLFRGSVLAKVIGGLGEIRILTANARARIQSGRAIVSYDPNQDESQVFGITSGSFLENRFEANTKTPIKAGEASSLNMGLKRLSPSTPRNASFASAREKLSGFGLGEEEMKKALASVSERRDRKLASDLPKKGVGSPVSRPDLKTYERYPGQFAKKKVSKGRAIASLKPTAKKKKAPTLSEIQSHESWMEKQEQKEKERIFKELDQMQFEEETLD